jgi:hypothetical protein
LVAAVAPAPPLAALVALVPVQAHRQNLLHPEVALLRLPLLFFDV